MSPVTFCGYKLDWIRRAYRSQMVLWKGGPPVTGRWYFVPRDTPYHPGADVFGSSRWLPTQGVGQAPVGEIRPKGDVWVNGSPPPIQCKESFGDETAWMGQATASSPMAVWCCGWPVRVQGQIVLNLRPSSSVLSPRRYRGLVSLNLRPQSPHFKVPFYRGLVSLNLRPASSYHKVGPYQGLVGLSLRPESPHWNARFYRGLVGLSLRADSPHFNGSFYEGLVSLSLRPQSNYTQAISGCWTNPVPSKLTFTVSGIGVGSPCDLLNGTRTLVWSTACQWNDTVLNPQGNPSWILQLNGSGVLLSAPTTIFLTRAQYGLATWDGSLPVTIPLSATFSCSGWPSSITVTS